MEKLVLYKYSNDEEAKIIEWMLKSRKVPYYLFHNMVDSYCYIEYINLDEFDINQFVTLYMDTLKDYTSKDSTLYESYDDLYIIISDKILDLIKDKLRDLDVPFISIVSLNIGCEEINTLPF